MRAGSRRFVLSLAPVLVLALGVMLFGALDLWRTYGEARRRGEENVQNLVRVLAEQTERTFQAVDFTLMGVIDPLVAHPDMVAHDAGFRDKLAKRLNALPYVRALFVVGPDGSVMHDTGYPSTPNISAADRPYFKAHQEDLNLGLHISHPLRSKSVNTWFVSFSRRINRPDGSFGGIAVAAVEPRYFESFYRSLSVGEGGFIALLLRDGTLLARSPAAEDAIGKSFAAIEPVRSLLSERPQGVFWGTSPLDGTPRVAGYQAIAGSPVVVLVGLAQQTVFQSWREHATVVLVTAAILLGLTTALVFLRLRDRRREQAERARLDRIQRLEALGRIAGGVAHDFGNTIRIVQSTCMLLRPALAGDPDARSLISDTERFLGNAKAMTERLLAFAGRQELRPQLTVIDDRISGFAAILKQAAGPRVEVELKLAGGDAACILDPVQFEATLLNLVLNARDAMPYGGTVTVETGAADPPRRKAAPRRSREADQPWVAVTVADTGVGMSPTVLEQAFDPFFTTKGPGHGSGLGLSQVLGFVQQSAGEVRLESEEGRGTTIRLMFPAVPYGGQETGSSDSHQAPITEAQGMATDGRLNQGSGKT